MKACKMRNICFCRLSIQAIYRSSGAVAADVRPPSKTLASASPLTHSRLSQLEVMLNSALLQALSNQHNRLPSLSVPLASRLISSLFTTLRPAAPLPTASALVSTLCLFVASAERVRHHSALGCLNIRIERGTFMFARSLVGKIRLHCSFFC